MKIFVCGGDGFCGWPVALKLSANGHDVRIIDNQCRRKIDRELGTSSLTPIRSLDERLTVWEQVSGRSIQFSNIDIVRNFEGFEKILRLERPDAIVHLAEQRSLPYSMRSIPHRLSTLQDNVSGTHNILAAITSCKLDVHLVHLSSIGVYGYETLGYQIQDGYIRSADVEREILHPANPVSIYHLSKALDQLVLQYYSKKEGIRITDLMQGTVWGTQTAETECDVRLINRYDYDAIFGTVLNRFVLQAVLGQPLTVYGRGEQTRAFIHITDTVRCIELALANPPQLGQRMNVLNQVAETQSVLNIAAIVSKLMGATIRHIDNPRDEPASNDLQVSNDGLSKLGFCPKRLDADLLDEIKNIVERFSSRRVKSHIRMPAQLRTTKRATRQPVTA